MSALTTNSDLISETYLYDYQGHMMGWTKIEGGQNIIFCSSLEQIDLSSWNAFFLEPWDLSAISVRHTIWSWSTCQDIKNYVTKDEWLLFICIYISVDSDFFYLLHRSNSQNQCNFLTTNHDAVCWVLKKGDNLCFWNQCLLRSDFSPTRIFLWMKFYKKKQEQSI